MHFVESIDELNQNPQKHTFTQTFDNIQKLQKGFVEQEGRKKLKPQAVHRGSLECTRCVPHADVQAVSHCSSPDTHIALGHHGNKFSIVNAAILAKESKIRTSKSCI
jgi:hypothetical protein